MCLCCLKDWQKSKLNKSRLHRIDICDDDCSKFSVSLITLCSSLGRYSLQHLQNRAWWTSDICLKNHFILDHSPHSSHCFRTFIFHQLIFKTIFSFFNGTECLPLIFKYYIFATQTFDISQTSQFKIAKVFKCSLSGIAKIKRLENLGLWKTQFLHVSLLLRLCELVFVIARIMRKGDLGFF